MHVERPALSLSNLRKGGEWQQGKKHVGTYPRRGHNSSKEELIADGLRSRKSIGVKEQSGRGEACGLSASWRGNGSPRLLRLGGVRARSPTMELRHGPYTYGWQ